MCRREKPAETCRKKLSPLGVRNKPPLAAQLGTSGSNIANDGGILREFSDVVVLLCFSPSIASVFIRILFSVFFVVNIFLSCFAAARLFRGNSRLAQRRTAERQIMHSRLAGYIGMRPLSPQKKLTCRTISIEATRRPFNSVMVVYCILHRRYR